MAIDLLARLSKGWLKTPDGTGTQYDVSFEVTSTNIAFDPQESHPES